jgi:ketosteroid isomerase-like protein
MRIPILMALALSAAAPTASGAAACPDLSAEEAAAHVRAAFDAWNEAVMRKDIDRTMAIFSPSIRFQFQGSPDFGYARLLAVYSENFARENAPEWHPVVENVIGSPQMVTLFNEWKLVPAGGGDPIAEYRGVDVFLREDDCAWRVTASLNYADKATLALGPGRSIGPAEVSNEAPQPRVAARDSQPLPIAQAPR